jgi:predicted acetyltransferase
MGDRGEDGQRAMTFEFRNWGVLTDGMVDLSVVKTEPEDAARGHVPPYHFGIARHGAPGRVGMIRLRVGSVTATPSLPTSGHVGYEVDVAHRGHGFALRAGRLLPPVALARGPASPIITCAPDRSASRITIERLGATYLGRFAVPPDHATYRDGKREVLRFEWFLAGVDGPAEVPEERVAT